jgi:hypothetical protein
MEQATLFSEGGNYGTVRAAILTPVPVAYPGDGGCLERYFIDFRSWPGKVQAEE